MLKNFGFALVAFYSVTSLGQGKITNRIFHLSGYEAKANETFIKDTCNLHPDKFNETPALNDEPEYVPLTSAVQNGQIQNKRDIIFAFDNLGNLMIAMTSPVGQVKSVNTVDYTLTKSTLTVKPFIASGAVSAPMVASVAYTAFGPEFLNANSKDLTTVPPGQELIFNNGISVSVSFNPNDAEKVTSLSIDSVGATYKSEIRFEKQTCSTETTLSLKNITLK